MGLSKSRGAEGMWQNLTGVGSLVEACGGWCSVGGSLRTFAWTESLAHHPDGGVVEAVVAVDATQ